MAVETGQAQHGPSALTTWRYGAARSLFVLVGLFFFLSSISKASDMVLFAEQIKAYGLVTHTVLVSVLAWGLVVTEWVLGMGLLLLYRPRVILPCVALVLVAFTSLTGWAWAYNVVEDCGCFGTWIQHTAGEKTVENLVVLAITAVAWMGYRAIPYTHRRRTSLLMWGACTVGLTAVTVLTMLTVPDLSAEKQEAPTLALELGTEGIQGVDYLDLRVGSHLVVLMGTDCGHCQECVPTLNMLAQDLSVMTVVALCPNAEDERMAFIETFHPLFPVGQISEALFWKLLADGTTPRVLLVQNGTVQRVWDHTVPGKEDIAAFMS
jgi:hypothetical protein